jgi:hypothetical protein
MTDAEVQVDRAAVREGNKALQGAATIRGAP